MNKNYSNNIDQMIMFAIDSISSYMTMYSLGYDEVVLAERGFDYNASYMTNLHSVIAIQEKGCIKEYIRIGGLETINERIRQILEDYIAFRNLINWDIEDIMTVPHSTGYGYFNCIPEFMRGPEVVDDRLLYDVLKDIQKVVANDMRSTMHTVIDPQLCIDSAIRFSGVIDRKSLPRGFILQDAQDQLVGKFLTIALLCPIHSGNKNYPVPHPTKRPSDAYNTEDNLWEGPYGDARISILNYVVETLEEKLKDDLT